MREPLWDVSRGIGILLVVFGHVLRGLNSAAIVPSNHWLMTIDYAIYTFHMPLFFLLAGLNAGKGLSKSGNYKNNLFSLTYPYLLWSTIQGLVQVAASGSTNGNISLKDLAELIIFKPFGQFWFLYALFLCQSFTLIARPNRFALVTISMIAYPLGVNFDLGIISKTLIFFLFYATGIIFSEKIKGYIELFSNYIYLAVFAIGLVISIAAAHFFGDYMSPTALPAAFIGIFFIFLTSKFLIKFNISNFFEIIGLASLPIYLMHILFGSGARIILMKFGIENIYIQLLSGMVAGSALSFISYYFLVKIRKESTLGFPSGKLLSEKLCDKKILT